MRKTFTLAIVAIFLFGVVTFGQTSNASISGFVQDASKAFVPGVTVTVTNTQTGVSASVVTNETGTYLVQSLLPGTYKLTASLPGFRTHTVNDMTLGAGVAAKYNIVMEVGQVNTSVEVAATASSLISDTSSSIGQVLSEQLLQDLPLVSNNVLDLMKTMAGVRGQGLGEATSFAGVSTGYVNTVRDGVSVQDGRYAAGVGSTTLMNPDMVGEFRVILTPVDAEMGRGNGQVQIVTRSGTNALHGSAVWSVRNSALDANTWSNNRAVSPLDGSWKPTVPTWINRHQATASVGGPIFRNKTFFFVLYDQQFERQRQTARPVVLTDCARNGIFRYWEGWGNGNILTPTNTSAAAPTIASVDATGKPLKPATNPSGTPYTGQLRYFSVFGPVTNTPTLSDCSDAQISGAPWDPKRPAQDPAGVSQRYLDVMPHADVFDGGDGLNTAVSQWVRSGHNAATFGLANGTDNNTDRKQINFKVDHNFNAQHKVAVNYSYEWIDGDYLGGGVAAAWPGNYTSEVLRRPRVLTVNATSTLSRTLLNEARFGYRANKHVIWAPWEVTDASKTEVPQSFLLQGGQNFPIAYQPAAVGAMSTNNYICMTLCAQQGNRTPLYDYADTLSWIKGKHNFKGGVDIRYAYTSGSETPTAPIPRATGGAGQNPNQAFANNPNLPGLVAANQTTANSLLYFQSGSVNQVFQYYFLQQSKDLHWDNYNSVPGHRKITEPHQNDWDLFFKDDWKITPSLTLNLGLRYEYYGVPYEGNGLTVVPVDGGHGLFGVSGRSFDTWLRPDNPVNMDLLTQVEFVGPKTVNEGRSIYKKDWNNFGPAVGFSYTVSSFGKPLTIRGGYQISYVGSGRLGNYSNYLFSNPGFLNQAISNGPLDGSLFDASNLPTLVPITPTTQPMQPVPLLKTGQAIYAYERDFKTPYVQNYTLSLNRDLTRKLNLDVRYVGTKGVALLGTININAPDVFYNPALFDAFERTRRGENVELFDQIFMGLQISGTGGPVNGTTQRGSEQMRNNATFRADLANGNFVNLANSLNTYNGIAPNGAVAATVPGETGTVLRRANKGFNVSGGTPIAGGPLVPAGLFPENWIVSNPQFGNTRYWLNSGMSNYHSLQVQTTLRPVAGVSLQATYVWSKALEVAGVNGLGGGLTSGDPVYTNPADRLKDYALAPNNVTHDFRSFGTFELPIGPNKLFMGNSSGAVARIVEGWQASFIVNASTGQPASIGAANMLYGNGVADIVRPVNLKSGEVDWSGQFGNYFGTGVLTKVSDPQCAEVVLSIRAFCSLQAIRNASTGEIVLQNPRPGSRGTAGRQTLELPGQWSFDAAVSKTFRITESMTAQFRMDATNILNHPGPGTPSFDINSTNAFGQINAKDDSKREFRANVRLNF
jgi:hypothetical protein